MRLPVYQLRRRGDKLPSDGLGRPMAGVLRLGYCNHHGRDALSADLHDNDSPGNRPFLAGLVNAELTVMEPRGFVLASGLAMQTSYNEVSNG